MSIKKLFEKNKQTTTVNKYLKKSAAGNLGDGIESAAHLSESIKKNNDFIRSYMSGLKIVNADSSSRVLIPKDLLEFAGLEKQIVLSSSVNIIEVWDKNEYEKSVSKSLKKFGDLAEEVMGNKNFNDIP